MAASAATAKIAGDTKGGRQIPMSSAAKIVVPSVRPKYSRLACIMLSLKPCLRLVLITSTMLHSTTNHNMFQMTPRPYCQAMTRIPGASANDTWCMRTPVDLVAGNLRAVRFNGLRSDLEWPAGQSPGRNAEQGVSPDAVRVDLLLRSVPRLTALGGVDSAP